jgi:hypothetical protein
MIGANCCLRDVRLPVDVSPRYDAQANPATHQV